MNEQATAPPPERHPGEVADHVAFSVLAKIGMVAFAVCEWHFRLLERLFLVSAVYVAAQFTSSATMTVLEKMSAAALSGWVMLTWVRLGQRWADEERSGATIGELWRTVRGRLWLAFGFVSTILGYIVMSATIDAVMSRLVVEVSAAAVEQLGRMGER